MQDPGEQFELILHTLYVSIEPFIIHSSSLSVALSSLYFHWAKQNDTHTLLNYLVLLATFIKLLGTIWLLIKSSASGRSVLAQVGLVREKSRNIKLIQPFWKCQTLHKALHWCYGSSVTHLPLLRRLQDFTPLWNLNVLDRKQILHYMLV